MRLGGGTAISSRLSLLCHPLDTYCIIFPKTNRSKNSRKSDGHGVISPDSFAIRGFHIYFQSDGFWWR